jgi:hypothetical protein
MRTDPEIILSTRFMGFFAFALKTKSKYFSVCYVTTIYMCFCNKILLLILHLFKIVKKFIHWLDCPFENWLF